MELISNNSEINYGKALKASCLDVLEKGIYLRSEKIQVKKTLS